MKVLHLIAPINFGGGESLLVNLLSEKREGIDEYVCSIYNSIPFNSKLTEIKVPHFELRNKSIGNGISKLEMGIDTIKTLVFLPKLIQIIKKEKIDIIHAHGFPASIMFFIVQNIIAVKGVYTHHSYRKQPKWIESKIFSYIYNSFDQLTGVSRHVSESMVSAFPVIDKQWKVVYNCVGNSFYQVSPTNFDFSVSRDRKTFIQVGRFSKFKNQAIVVEALSQLSKKDRDKLLIIFVGDGENRTKIEQFVKKHKLSASVLFLGAVSYDKIPHLISEADYGLFPSENEGFGIGAVECLAVGLPVLTLDTDLMREIIGEAGIQAHKKRMSEGFKLMLDLGPALKKKTQKQAEKYRCKSVKDKYCIIYDKVYNE